MSWDVDKEGRETERKRRGETDSDSELEIDSVREWTVCEDCRDGTDTDKQTHRHADAPKLANI
jgi:hypothetical protein